MRHPFLATVVLLAGVPGASAEDWRITTAGYGPARIDMTVAQASKVLGTKLVSDGPINDPGCHYMRPEPAVEGLWFMISNDRVARVDVIAPGVTTRSGLGVGNSEDRVKEVLGSAVEVTPHKYLAPDGNYLTIWSSDRKSAVRFETLQGKVTSFYAGRASEVEDADGCS
jgi:hypothetical protein